LCVRRICPTAWQGTADLVRVAGPTTVSEWVDNGHHACQVRPLRRFLEDCADDEPVSLTFDDVDALVGGLPPSARGRTWWGNTTNTTRVQAYAWLRACRPFRTVWRGGRPSRAMFWMPALDCP